MAAIGGLGAAFVLYRSGTHWTPLIELTAPDTTGDRFGTLVALGGALVVGAPNRNGLEGAADVFGLPGISDGGIVHSASFAHTVAPGSIASIFGSSFAPSNATAGTLPLPDSMNGFSMTVNNVAAPLIFGVGVIGVLYTMLAWWRDVIREAQYDGYHTRVVQISQEAQY